VKLFLSLLGVASLGAYDLIHISNSVDFQNLRELEQKYKREIVISDNRAYLIPSECLLERYFGGLSQNMVELPNSELYNTSYAVTQKIFNAKDETEIKDEIAKQKISDTIEAKEAREFLSDRDGRLFGGLSQGDIDLSKQKEVVIQSIEDKANFTRPTCQLLEDGSGYKIYGTKELKLYSSKKIVDIKERVLFK
jgi:hypothetical protein